MKSIHAGGVSIRKQADLASDGHLINIATLADFGLKRVRRQEMKFAYSRFDLISIPSCPDRRGLCINWPLLWGSRRRGVESRVEGFRAAESLQLPGN